MTHLMLLTALVPEHLGGLHPFERLLVLLVAFGPFVVLGVVVWVVRRRVVAEEAEREAQETGRTPREGADPDPARRTD